MVSMNVFENTTKSRQFPLNEESSLIAFSLSESTVLPTFLYQERILSGKFLLSISNRYRNRVISLIFLLLIAKKTKSYSIFPTMFPVSLFLSSSIIVRNTVCSSSGSDNGVSLNVRDSKFSISPICSSNNNNELR